MKINNILLVDDEVIIAGMMAELLEAQGFKAEVATSGRDGVEKVNKSSFDLIISDVRMEDGDGMFLLRETRASELNKDTPFIFLTGFDDVSRAGLDDLGVLKVLKKPLRSEEIIEEIKSIS